MTEPGILLEPGEKEDLFELVEFYFDTRTRRDTLAQALGRNKDTLRKHRNEEIDVLPLEVAERVYSVIEESEPRFRLDDPERYTIPEESRVGVSEDSVKVKDRFQSFLFEHLTLKEFEDLTGLSRSSFNSYRRNKRERIDEEVYSKVFDFVREKYERGFPVGKVSLVDVDRYRYHEGDFAESVMDREDLDRDYRVLEEIEIEHPLYHRFCHIFEAGEEGHVSVLEQKDQYPRGVVPSDGEN